MKRILIYPVLLFVMIFELKAQTAINTRNADNASILEISSSTLGILFPRLNISSLSTKSPVTAAIMPDGLLAFNNGGTNSQTLYYWDVLANSTAGAWIQQLYFKETPKVAFIGLINNLALLDNKIQGEEERISPAVNNFQMISSGYMPGLKLNNKGNGRIVVGPGTYTLEISYLLNAPPANPSTNASTIGTSPYYNMGYFSDLWLRSFTPNTSAYGSFNLAGRVEGAILSKVSVDHRMRFLHTFTVAGVGQVFELDMYLGRRDGTTFYDLVNVIASGTIIKLTKLN